MWRIHWRHSLDIYFGNKKKLHYVHTQLHLNYFVRAHFETFIVSNLFKIQFFRDSNLNCAHHAIFVGKVDHPALTDDLRSCTLGVFHRLNHSHQRNVTACGRAASSRDSHFNNVIIINTCKKVWVIQHIHCLENGRI